jgi:hypothetical protein
VAGVAAVACLALGAGPVAADGANPVASSLVRTVLAGSAAFKVHAHVTVPEEVTYLAYGSGEVGGGGARAYLAASERGHGALRAQVRVLFAGGGPVFYVHVPQLTDELPQGKRWVRATVGDLLGLAGVSPASVGHLSIALNPASLLRLLGSITTEPKRVGPVLIAGHLTQRYHLTIHLNVLAAHASLPPEAKARLGSLNPISVDAWIDQSDGYLRQLQIAYTASGQAPPHGVVTIQLHDFGSPVRVTAPPAAATVAVTDLD